MQAKLLPLEIWKMHLNEVAWRATAMARLFAKFAYILKQLVTNYIIIPGDRWQSLTCIVETNLETNQFSIIKIIQNFAKQFKNPFMSNRRYKQETQ